MTEIPSKTQRKKQMHELQALGTELVELSAQQLAALDLPETLRDAVMDAREITKFEARRRQLQYIGKLMRSVDPEPIRKTLAVSKAASRAHTARLHLIERWRERLLDDEAALDELITEQPQADVARLRLLIRNVQREREAGQPPKSFRELFRLLDETLKESDE
jgi:ribosome-associated protein